MKLRRRHSQLNSKIQQKNYNTINYFTHDNMIEIEKKHSLINKKKIMSLRVSKNYDQTNSPQKQSHKQIKNAVRKLSKVAQSKKTLISQASEQKSLSNVNSFKHLLSIPSIDYSNIKWTAGLRIHQSKTIQRSGSQVPGVFYKPTQTSKAHHEVTDLQKNVNYGQFQHLTSYGHYPSMGTLKFHTSLRSPQKASKSPQILKKQRQFDAFPLKSRLQYYPKLLNSNSIKKKTINPEQDLQSGFDGLHNYPTYTNRIIKDRNYNNLREMIIKPKIRGKINLPTLGWQTNLRCYQSNKVISAVNTQ